MNYPAVEAAGLVFRVFDDIESCECWKARLSSECFERATCGYVVTTESDSVGS
jgi:hypothetical protein